VWSRRGESVPEPKTCRSRTFDLKKNCFKTRTSITRRDATSEIDGRLGWILATVFGEDIVVLLAHSGCELTVAIGG